MRYLLLLLSLLASQPVYASTLGAVTGIVVDSVGVPVVGAEIRIDSGTRLGMTTAPDGRFVIAGVPVGLVTISISTTPPGNELKIETTVIADSTFDLGTIRLGVAVQSGLKGATAVNEGIIVDGVEISDPFTGYYYSDWSENYRNGIFYGLLVGISRTLGQPENTIAAGLRLGIGYGGRINFEDPGKSEPYISLESSIALIKESEEVWLQISSGIGVILFDRVMIGAGGAWNLFGGRSGGIFVPSIGYELDHWIWSLAPSFRLVGHYSGSSPSYALQIELRNY